MNERELQTLLASQRSYFASGATRSFASRMHGLKALKEAVKKHEKDLAKALKKDLGKSSSESYMCETGLVLSELNWMMKHLKALMREKNVPTPFPICRPQLPQPFTLRQCADYEPLELPCAPYLKSAYRRPCRRKHRHP